MEKPDSNTLKLFHTIVMVNYNLYEDTPVDNEKLVQEYLKKEILIEEQLQQYYSSLFVSIINKNRPFDYSKQSWDLDKLGLKKDTEKATFFLVFIDKICSQISLYRKAYDGPNWKGIREYSQLLPKINNKDYYEYDTFNFSDFKMNIYKKNRYFKEYYLLRFTEVIIGHILMMENENYSYNKINNFLLSTFISKEENSEYCVRMDVVNSYLEKK